MGRRGRNNTLLSGGGDQFIIIIIIIIIGVVTELNSLYSTLWGRWQSCCFGHVHCDTRLVCGSVCILDASEEYLPRPSGHLKTVLGSGVIWDLANLNALRLRSSRQRAGLAQPHCTEISQAKRSRRAEKRTAWSAFWTREKGVWK
jgi:hypothetical protein